MKDILKAIRNFIINGGEKPVYSEQQPAETSDFLLINPMPPLNQCLEEKIVADSLRRDDNDESAAPEVSNENFPRDSAEDNKHLTDFLPPVSLPNNIIEEVVQQGTTEPDDLLSKKETGQIVAPSLLANSRFVKLVEECADIMNEFDSYTERLETEEGKYMVQLFVKRLQESLERSGLSRIENEEAFSILRHIPVPLIPVADGESLEGIVSPGLLIENRVFRKAKVLIKKNKNDEMQ